jgi:P-type Ca2+ transporter type 2C
MEPYRQTSDDVLERLGTNAQSGLSQAQAQERLGRYSRNELEVEPPVPEWQKFLFTSQYVAERRRPK